MAEFNYFIDLSNVTFAEGQRTTWLHAMPLQDKVKHPFYGDMDFGESALTAYANSVLQRTLGTVDPVIDYDHQMYAGIAAGWVKSARVVTGDVAGNGLQLFVEWTDEAVKRVKAKEYRYFSPTFNTDWEDQYGKKHKNVIFGGGLTNRPYLKNLVPVNLSEITFQVPSPGPSPTSEDEMDMKKLRESLGLPETTSDEDTWKAFTENMAKLAQLSVPIPPVNDPPPAPIVPPAPAFEMSETVKALAASNPQVKAMIEAFEHQARSSATMQAQLREQQIMTKLNDLDRSNLIVTPKTKDLIHDIAAALNDAQAEKLWALMDHFLTSQAFVVELGERGRSGTQYSRDKTARQLFEERTATLVGGGMAYADAVLKVSADDPQLYDSYRAETFIVQS
jgi:hypothetical protein